MMWLRQLKFPDRYPFLVLRIPSPSHFLECLIVNELVVDDQFHGADSVRGVAKLQDVFPWRDVVKVIFDESQFVVFRCGGNPNSFAVALIDLREISAIKILGFADVTKVL